MIAYSDSIVVCRSSTMREAVGFAILSIVS